MKTVTHAIRVRYGDTDQMGVVYYANYLRWFEIARAEWLRANGRTYKDFEDAGCMLPVIEAAVRYRKPARYDEVIELDATPTVVRAASIRFEYKVRRGIELLADGSTTHACTNKEGRPVRWPESFGAFLNAAVAVDEREPPQGE